ncbi:hypothetical protein VI01_21685 [Pantoea sp. SM3]|nr:hypothetical protein VI01_21685 [Pantoea sp. SM3]
MRAVLALQGQFGENCKALQRIHATDAKSLTLTQLAMESGISVPTFHKHFKAIARMPPMHYVKLVYLHQAHMLIVRL